MSCPWWQTAPKLALDVYGGSLATIDLDGDAQDELVVQPRGGGGLVSLRDAFGRPVDTEINASYGMARSKDLNADALSDLLILGGSGIEAWLNDGRGGLVRSTVLDRKSSNIDPVSSVALLDYDGDRTVDIASIDDNRGVLVFRGIAEGRFEPGLPIAALDNVRGVYGLDADGNGRMDILTFDGKLGQVHLSSGSGWTTLPAHPMNAPLLTMDLTGDNLPDVLDKNLLVYAATAQGDLEPARALFPSRGPHGARSAISGDFDGDGRIDLITSGWGRLTLWSAQAGGFQLTAEYRAERVLALANVVSDRTPDLVIEDDEYGVRALRGLGKGQFEGQRSYGDDFIGYGQAWLSDVDGDGHTDLVHYSETRDDYYGDLVAGVNVARGDGQGAFAQDPVRTSEISGALRLLLRSDLNGDGREDLLFRELTGTRLVSWFGQENATFGGMQAFPHTCGSHDAQMRDADADGDLDAVFGAGSCVLFNDGSNHWSSQGMPPAQKPCGRELYLDNDLIFDCLEEATDGTYLRMGVSPGQFAERKPLAGTAGADLYYATAADLDSDGRRDLVLTLVRGHTRWISIRYLGPDGEYGPPRDYPMAQGQSHAVRVLNDLNGDDHQEIMIYRGVYDTSDILVSDVHGQYRETAAMPTCDDLVGIQDLNLDGAPELVCAGSGRGVFVYQGFPRTQCQMPD